MSETLYQKLKRDVRFQEGLKACLNFGVCTAIYPAARFYDYDPLMVVDTIQTANEAQIEELLKSDTIWSCGGPPLEFPAHKEGLFLLRQTGQDTLYGVDLTVGKYVF